MVEIKEVIDKRKEVEKDENKTCGECRFYHPIFKHEGVCICTSEFRKTCDFTSGCNIGGVYPKPPPTNGDKIRQGGDYALAQFKLEHKCDVCAYAAPIDVAPACRRPDGKVCFDGMLAWLSSPAESEVKNEETAIFQTEEKGKVK